MIAARSPAIAGEETRVDVTTMGLLRDSARALVIGYLLTSIPATIKELKSKFKVLQNVYQPILRSVLPPPPQPSTPMFTGNYTFRRPYRHFFYASSTHPVADYFSIKNSVSFKYLLELQLSTLTQNAVTLDTRNTINKWQEHNTRKPIIVRPYAPCTLPRLYTRQHHPSPLCILSPLVTFATSTY